MVSGAKVDMTKSMIACVLLATLVARAAAQLPVEDRIYLRETTLGACEMFDRQPGMLTINVYHAGGFGLAARFRVESDPGATMVYAGETHHFVSTLGDVQSGVQVCYDRCMYPGSDTPLISIDYFTLGTSSTCAGIRVVPHPDAEVIEIAGCDGVPKNAFGGVLFINPAFACSRCEDTWTRYEGATMAFSCEPLPVAPATWGAIKALYR